MTTTRRKTNTRKSKVAANVRAYYSRAEYVTPRVALDRPTTSALRHWMKDSGLGVSDAIRTAILAAGKQTLPKAKKTGPVSRPR